MKPQVLAVGSLTQDIFLKPRRQEIFKRGEEEFIAFCLGDKVKIKEKRETFGGGGANVAVGLSRFGIPSALLGRIGSDSVGGKIIENLENENVSHEFVQKAENEESGFSVILSAGSGERTVLFASGANKTFCEFDEKILENFEAICLQHLSGCAINVFQKIRKCMQKNPEIFLSWNPGRETFEQGVEAFFDFFPAVDLLLMNKEEAMLFTGKKNLEDIFRSFYKNGLHGNVVITDGMKGAKGCDGKNIHFCPVLMDNIKRIDTLGAGDSFLTGLTAGALRGKDLPEAMKLGTINAAHVVGKFGAQEGLQKEQKLNELTHLLQVDTKPFSL